ncbi:hypothetical protein DFH08DRAFT_859708, partial [Mycena albidolilacea]
MEAASRLSFTLIRMFFLHTPHTIPPGPLNRQEIHFRKSQTLESLTQNLEAAWLKGQVFNAQHTNSYMAIAEIAESVSVMARNVLRSPEAGLPQSSSSQATIVSGAVTGGTRGNASIGGEGGEGDGSVERVGRRKKRPFFLRDGPTRSSEALHRCRQALRYKLPGSKPGQEENSVGI